MKILYFSYLSRDKGIHIAMEAANKITRTNPDVKFIFAGPVESPLGLDIKHNYLGYIESTVEKEKIFKSADIFIFPTLRDAFGLVLLEAMKAGLPIVASREGCIPEILPHGLLFTKGNVEEMASQIMALISDEKLRQRLGAFNRSRYEANYTIEKYGQRMIQSFKTMEHNDYQTPIDEIGWEN